MSKKRSSKKKPAKKVVGPKFPKKPIKPTKVWKASRSHHASPRSQVLPGMRQVRDSKLDELCESIADELGAINLATQSKAGSMSAALQRMQGRNLTSYLHGGVRLTRVPGSEKVSVRLVKDQGEAQAPEPIVGRPTSEPDDAFEAEEPVEVDLPDEDLAAE